MIVYVITNSVNGKKYVGLTTCKLKKRWNEHMCAANNGVMRPLYKAMRKYGIAAFTIEEVATSNNIENLKLIEIEYIQKLNTYLPEGKGYNLTRGGEGCNKITSYFGEEQHNAKLTEKAVIFIRNSENTIYTNGTLVSMVADKFGIMVSRDCIRDARRGSSWTYLNETHPPVKMRQGERVEPISDAARNKATLTLNLNREKAIIARIAKYEGKRGPNAKLSEENVISIFNSSESLLKTAYKYGVSKKMVLLIKQRKTHKYITERL